MFKVIVRYPKEMLQKTEQTLFYLERMAVDYGAISVESDSELSSGRVNVKSGIVNVTTAVFPDGRFGTFVDLLSKIFDRHTDERLATDNPGSPPLQPPLTEREYCIDIETIKGTFGSIKDDEDGSDSE